MEHFVEGTARTNNTEHSENAECAQSSRRKDLTNSLEQKIKCLEKQRKELLEVNQQWDQQFRNMRALYEKKVADLKTKLDLTERLFSALDPELQQRLCCTGLSPEGQQRREKEKENLSEELHDLKKENMLLKEKNALANKKKEHYECEIKRLNKALQNALKINCAFSECGLGKFEMECSHEELRTEMEVLKQQVRNEKKLIMWGTEDLLFLIPGIFLEVLVFKTHSRFGALISLQLFPLKA